MGKVIRTSCWHQNFVSRGPYTCIKWLKNMYKIRLQRIFLKLATNGQSDKAFLLTSKFVPKRLSAPALGLYTSIKSLKNTGHSRYVDFAYLDTVEVIVHSQYFFSMFLCISTPSMSKMVNMKVSRSDFSCPRRIFYYICYCLCQSKNRRLHGRHIVCYVHV